MERVLPELTVQSHFSFARPCIQNDNYLVVFVYELEMLSLTVMVKHRFMMWNRVLEEDWDLKESM
jgi:hypothetical protein